MKKYFVLIMMFVLVCASGCSCAKFDKNTYSNAVRNFKNSTGYSYNLVITINNNKKDYIISEESTNMYMLSTTGKVENYLSELKEYEIVTHKYGYNDSPELIYTLDRYYVGSTSTLYVAEKDGTNRKTTNSYHISSYEEQYNDENDRYNMNNIIPYFDSKNVENMEVNKLGKNNAIITFFASCPAYTACSDEKIEYKVVINSDLYFSSIEFSYNKNISEEEIETYTYKYTFDKYNGDVVITFPEDLGNYSN